MFKKLFARLSGKYVAVACNHPTKREGEVRAFGECTTTHMPLNENGTAEWCLECLGKMAVKCAWCEQVIFIGDPITLYTQTKSDFKLPANAALYKQEPLQVVGCLRMSCADTGADRAGFWVPGDDGKGGVHRVASPLELSMVSGAEIAMSNLGNMKVAHKVQDTIFRHIETQAANNPV